MSNLFGICGVGGPCLKLSHADGHGFHRLHRSRF
jgi:hypothetical protein